MVSRSNLERTVEDVMTSAVVTVSPQTSISDALELMQDEKISALPIMEEERCIGFVTVSDLVALIRGTDEALRSDYPHFDDCLWAVELVQRQLDTDPVRKIMSEVLVYAEPHQTLSEAAETMVRAAVHHLPVIKRGTLVGLISSLDLVRAIAGIDD